MKYTLWQTNRVGRLAAECLFIALAGSAVCQSHGNTSIAVNIAPFAAISLSDTVIDLHTITPDKLGPVNPEGTYYAHAYGGIVATLTSNYDIRFSCPTRLNLSHQPPSGGPVIQTTAKIYALPIGLPETQPGVDEWVILFPNGVWPISISAEIDRNLSMAYISGQYKGVLPLTYVPQ